jgi:hypothetical protein
MKNLSEMWPDFLKWVDDYVELGKGVAANIKFSREDMRYAYQAGYEKGISEKGYSEDVLYDLQFKDDKPVTHQDT